MSTTDIFPGLNKLAAAGLYTHMPFVYGNANNPALIFCARLPADSAWELYATSADSDVCQRISSIDRLGLSKCNPYVLQFENTQTCHFRLWPEPDSLKHSLPLFLYRCPLVGGVLKMSDLEFAVQADGIVPFSVYADADVTVGGFRTSHLCIRTADKYMLLRAPPGSPVLRVTRAKLAGIKLLVTYKAKADGRYETQLVDVDARTAAAVLVRGENVYKSHIFGDLIIHATATSEHGRGLVVDHYELGEAQPLAYYEFSDDAALFPPDFDPTIAAVEALDMYWNNTPHLPRQYVFENAYARYLDMDNVHMQIEVSALLPDPPKLSELAANFSAAMTRWVKAGFKTVEREEFDRRTDICMGCPFWEPRAYFGLGRCRKCGCAGGKRWLATEKCPIGKW